MKKALSPLIAVLLLLVLAVSIGIIVTSNISSLVQVKTHQISQAHACTALFTVTHASCRFLPPSLNATTEILLHLNGTLVDEAGSDNNLILYGDANFVEGKSGSALEFSGNGYAKMNNTEDFNPSEITVEIWVKIE